MTFLCENGENKLQPLDFKIGVKIKTQLNVMC